VVGGSVVVVVVLAVVWVVLGEVGPGVVVGGGLLVVAVPRRVVLGTCPPVVVDLPVISGNPGRRPTPPSPLVVVGMRLPEASVGAGMTSPPLPVAGSTVVDGMHASRVAHCDDPLTGPPIVRAATTPSTAAAAAAIPQAVQRPCNTGTSPAAQPWGPASSSERF
jgi:hypothetical protein